MSVPAVRGLVPILATPFDEAGRLDAASLRRLVDFLLGAGAEGLAVFGMASEGFALTAEERAAILATVTAASGPGVPVVAGVGATSTVTAVEQGVAAVDGGATALMVLPPHMVKASPGQLLDFYGEVATRTGVGVMVQDAPAATGVAMSVDQLVELSKLSGVDSVKVEAPPTPAKVGAVVDRVDGEFAVLGGQNAMFVLEEHGRGAVGTMPACEFTDLLTPVLADWRAGRAAQARASFGRLLPLIRFGMQPGTAWAVHKEVLVRRRIIAHPTVRLPAAPLDRKGHQELDQLLADLGLGARR